MKKVIYAMVAVVLVIGLSLSCAPEPAPPPPPTPTPPTPAPPTPAPPAPPEPIVLKVVSFVPKGHPIATNTEIFKERIERVTEGQIMIDWLGGPEVIDAFDQPEAVRTGVIDAVLHISGMYCKALVPEASSLGLAHAPWIDRDTEVWPLWQEIFGKKMNARLISRPESGTTTFHIYTGEKRVEKVADLNGLTLRVAALYIPFMKAVGVAPIEMPGGEIYTAMERGVVDGFIWPEFNVYAFGLHEVTKYRLDPGFFTLDAVSLINLDTWNKMPKHLQDVLEAAGADNDYETGARAFTNAESEWKLLEEAGMTKVSMAPDEAKQFLKICYDETWEDVLGYCPEYGPKLREILTK